jgi:hypothetical protein
MSWTYHIAWWNLENLFDHRDAPRSDKLKRAIGDDLRDWTAELRDEKIARLAAVVARLGGGRGPDMLGVCEVENEAVLQRFVGCVERMTARKFEYVHYDTQDARGIDVAFIFDGSLFAAAPGQRFHHVVMRRTATREILQVTFRTHLDRTFIVMGNHWPARSEGVLESECYRQIAGETLAYFHQRVMEVHGQDTPVLAMGDFNDQPCDRSLVQNALSVQQRAKALNAVTRPLFFNMMWEAAGRREGTFYFDGTPYLLDQFMANRNMIDPRQSPLCVVDRSAEVRAFDDLRQPGDYGAPIPFGGVGRKPVNVSGYSDHFPIEMQMVERLAPG